MMNQPRPTPVGASSDKEMISMAEEELARLQRQLRIMEEDRVAFLEETNVKLAKQRNVIRVLKNEKDTLTEDLRIATSSAHKRKDIAINKRIEQLVREYEKQDKFTRMEKEQLNELEVQIKKMEDDVKKLRPKTAVTENDYQYRLTSGQKSIKMLQDRLDNAVKKFCKILTENKALREDINHLLKERSNFNDIWEKLLKDMNNGKKYMVELIEQATLAFDQREEWCTKLIALKKRAESDLLHHTEEMREIQRNLDHDLSLREFLNVKGQKRILKDLEEKERQKKEFEAQNLENQMHTYEKTLEQIEKFCNEHNIERIASQYLKQEEENFALFNYVNELNHEIETLKTNLSDMQEKIDEQIEISRLRSKERQATMKTIQYDLDHAIIQAEENKLNFEKSEEKLALVLNGIGDIFNLLNCDRGPILDLLGDDSSINLFNVKIYLGTIEKRISEMITKLYFIEKAMLTQSKKFIRENMVKLIN